MHYGTLRSSYTLLHYGGLRGGKLATEASLTRSCCKLLRLQNELLLLTRLHRGQYDLLYGALTSSCCWGHDSWSSSCCSC